MLISIIRSKVVVTLFSLLCCVLFLSLLQLYVNNDLLFPSLGTTIKTLFLSLGAKKTYLVLGHTFLRLLIALGISFLVGGFLGVLAGRFKFIATFLKPWMIIVRSIPLAAIIVIIMIILGFEKSPYLITTIMLVPVIYEAFKNGILNLDIDLMQVWQLESKFNFKVLSFIIFPLARPFIKTAFNQSVGLGVKVLVMAEFICYTPNSIGRELGSAANNLEYNLVFAWSLIAIFFVLIVEALPKLFSFLALKLERRGL